jgi:hypothetical protein
MVLDEGLFVAAANTATGLQYQYDTAAAFEVDPEDASLVVATVGEVGKQDSWVNEVMISTIRGNDAAFKGATIKPKGTVSGDPDEWLDYEAGSLAKIKLPAAGVWKISIDQSAAQINFVKLEGEENKEPLEEIPNTTVVVVKGLERQPTASEQPKDEAAGIEEGTGQPWDNQFWIVSNRELTTGEETILKFKYKSSIDAKTSTQLHGEPGAYVFWNAIGDVNFVGGEEWQEYEKEFAISSGDNGATITIKSIAFNMAEIKEACDYYITDVVWMTKDKTETLIDTEGTKNFWVKEGAGTSPYEFGTDPAGIRTVSTTTSGSAVVYNLAGQRVTKDYKGIVVKSGKKFVVK